MASKIRDEWRVVKYWLRGRRFLKHDAIIFVHVPKCAGSSINSYCKSLLDSRFFGKSVRINDVQLDTSELARAVGEARRAAYVYGHMSWDTMTAVHAQRCAFVFTFLRDPVDRLQSLYRYATNLPASKRARAMGDSRLAQRIGTMSPLEYFSCDAWRLRFDTNNFMVRQFAGNLNYIPDSKAQWEEAVNRAKKNLKSIDMIGFHHTFSNDFERLISKLMMPRPKAVPQVNRTSDLLAEAPCSVDSVFDKRTMKVIEPLVRYDYQLFDWARTNLSRN